jgi:hypothetical protein
MTKRAVLALLFTAAVYAATPAAREPQTDARLKHAFRRPPQNGWIFVHLEGTPSEIGYQHGFLLAPEIADTQKAIALSLTHDSKPWPFFREAAERILWPHIETQYREELQGIVEGVNARGVKLDLWDIVTMNAWLEFSPYYTNWYDAQHKTSFQRRPTADHCSAFVATGSFTKDGKIVIAHNTWTDYVTGARWNAIFDITPIKGHRILMDGMPGLIHSGDDFGVNAAGIAITETTISQFNGFDPTGIPEFVRARKAMQYASSIDDFARIMEDGNNGGYANNWLIADRKANEIASLELGLKNVHLRRSKDGYFAGSNYPVDPKLIKEETDFDAKDMSNSPNARHLRWDQLMAQYKGRIDIGAGEKFLADHYDTFDRKTEPDERTLCGHIDLSARGAKPWQPSFGPAGAAQNKITDSAHLAEMSFFAAFGHSCGTDFKAAEHLRKHPEFAWQKDELEDVNSRPWTFFRATK